MLYLINMTEFNKINVEYCNLTNNGLNSIN